MGTTMSSGLLSLQYTVNMSEAWGHGQGRDNSICYRAGLAVDRLKIDVNMSRLTAAIYSALWFML